MYAYFCTFLSLMTLLLTAANIDVFKRRCKELSALDVHFPMTKECEFYSRVPTAPQIWVALGMTFTEFDGGWGMSAGSL